MRYWWRTRWDPRGQRRICWMLEKKLRNHEGNTKIVWRKIPTILRNAKHVEGRMKKMWKNIAPCNRNELAELIKTYSYD